MVVRMSKWSPWPVAAAATRKFQVRVKIMRLEGIPTSFGGDDRNKAEGQDEKDEVVREKVVAMRIKWKGEPKLGFIPFHRASKQRRDFTCEKEVADQKNGNGGGDAVIGWEDDEFDNVCSFATVSRTDEFGPWDVSFYVLYGEKTEIGKAKMTGIGKLTLNIGEIASTKEPQVERKLPITLHLAGVSTQATLQVCFNFAEIRDAHDSAEIVHDPAKSAELKSPTRSDLDGDKDERNSHVGSERVDSEEILNESVPVEIHGAADEERALTGSGSSTSSETQLHRVTKPGWFSWKKRRLSFNIASKNKVEPLIKKTNSFSSDWKSDFDPQLGGSSTPDSVTNSSTQIANGSENNVALQNQKNYDESNKSGTISDVWESKDLVSRDGETKLKASVYFASFDQRSEKAAGESACTALVAVISHWLHSNRKSMPNRAEFDNLIVQGASKWQKLCQVDVYLNDFPNKHFDLETVLHSGICPVIICREKSYIGFFSPEKFCSAKGLMSFDEIWDKISNINEGEEEPRIYIISWNDHFFVLKMEGNAYYIIDTLGERLFEGCNQAFILRFDDSSLMHGRADKGRDDSKVEITSGVEKSNDKEQNEEIICRGKDCCREFIKRFLAAIPLKELEEEENKEAVSYYSLHHRLQIEFNFSYLIDSNSSSASQFFSPGTSTSSF